MDERMLRHALMEANLERFRDVLDAAEEPDWSHRYLRNRTRLLADPFGWAKRMARPVWKRAARTAACVLLACLVTLGGLMAVSPAVRAAVLGWFHQVQEDLVTFINPKRTVAEDPPGGWRLSEIPEGFVLTDVSPKESSGYWRYYEPGTGAWLWFAVYTPEAGEVATNVDGASDAGENHTTVTVQGYQADLFQSEGTILLIWQNEAGYLFMLRATDFGDTETLLSMAEGVVPYEGPGVAWEMGWVPEGYEPMYRDEGAGAVQQVWVRDGTTLTWQYVTDPICPFETPEGEPEEIDLRGVTGWSWTAEEEPEESEGPTITVNGKEIQAEGSSVTVGGVTIITGGSPDMEETGTLIWTDPDTNTTFFLEGALDRFDLRDMAVRTEETEPQLSPPTKRAQSITGTAGGGK